MDLTFAVNLGRVGAAEEVVSAARRAEEAGFDAVTVADHLGAPAPFPLLAVAAAVTERVRLRTYVLDAYFWNPALLAREVATLDRLSGGRVELGVGAGHMRHEHEDAGLPFPGIAERWEHTGRVVEQVRRRLADPEHRPAPVQQPVPVMVASMGERGLRAAAATADVVGLTGLVQVPGQPAGTFTFVDTEVVDERVEQVRGWAAQAGRQDPVLDVLVQRVELGRDPREWAEEMAAEMAGGGAPGPSADDLLASPFLLAARTAAEAAELLRERAHRWGITSWSTHAPSGDAFAEVVAVLHAR